MSYHQPIGAWTAFGSTDANLLSIANSAMAEIKSDTDALEKAAKLISAQQSAVSVVDFLDVFRIFDRLTAGRQEAADAALNEVAAARQFLAVTAPDLLSKAAAGDDNALVNLARAAQNIRNATVSVANDVAANISVGAFVQRFIDEVIKKTGKDLGKDASPWLYALGGAIVLGLFFRIKG